MQVGCSKLLLELSLLALQHFVIMCSCRYINAGVMTARVSALRFYIAEFYLRQGQINQEGKWWDDQT